MLLLPTISNVALILGAAFSSASSPVDVSTPSCEASRFLTISTTNGPITGHPASNSACVLEYLGIPFAQPPVGDLRFAPPEKIQSQKPYIAAKFGADCPLTPSKLVDYPGFTPQAQRIVNYFASAAGTPQSEDCLTLNIWAKTTQTSLASEKPVLVFFYGGSEQQSPPSIRRGVNVVRSDNKEQGSPLETQTALSTLANTLPTQRTSSSSQSTIGSTSLAFREPLARRKTSVSAISEQLSNGSATTSSTSAVMPTKSPSLASLPEELPSTTGRMHTRRIRSSTASLRTRAMFSASQ